MTLENSIHKTVLAFRLFEKKCSGVKVKSSPHRITLKQGPVRVNWLEATLGLNAVYYNL